MEDRVKELELRLAEMQLLYVDLSKRLDDVEAKNRNKKSGVFLDGVVPSYRKYYEEAVKKAALGGTTK